MYKIIWCICILVSLNEASELYHFSLTSHPNMIEYLDHMTPEKSKAAKHPPLNLFCEMLKESRIFKAVDSAAPDFQLLRTDWELLLDFTNPSLVLQENSSLQELNTDTKKEIDKLGQDRQYNSQLLCFKSPEYHYYLVFNWGDIILDYDKLVIVNHVENKESAILGLVQMHRKGTCSLHWLYVDEPIYIEEEYVRGINENYALIYPPQYEIIKKETFCSLKKYHLLNYCSRALNLFWDLLQCYFIKFPGMADPSPMNSVEIDDCKCIDGEVNLLTRIYEKVHTVFLPCTINHGGGVKTLFHLTPSAGLFVAKNTGGDNYTLYGHIYHMDVIVRNIGEQ